MIALGIPVCSQNLVHDQMASQGEIVTRNIGVVITTADIERICDVRFFMVLMFHFRLPILRIFPNCHSVFVDTKKGNVDMYTRTK